MCQRYTKLLVDFKLFFHKRNIFFQEIRSDVLEKRKPVFGTLEGRNVAERGAPAAEDRGHQAPFRN